MIILETIKLWEELGQQLEKKIAAYLDTCKILESSTSDDLASVHGLVSRIDRRLESFPTCLSQQLALAHSSIARTRNTIISPAHRLPHEILSKIFHVAVYSTDISETSQLTCEYTIRMIYQRLHTLMYVCSMWRRIGLEEAFWAFVPIVEQPSGRYVKTAAKLSLERAPNHRLGLVAKLKDSRPNLQDFVVRMISQYGHRFDSININLHSSSSSGLIRSMWALIRSLSRKQVHVKDLSLCYTPPQGASQFLNPTEGLFSIDSPARPTFECLLGSLRVLHFNGFMVPFKGTSLRNLTELTLQGLGLRNDVDYVLSLRALASSSQLRTLKIITVGFLAYPADKEDLLDDLAISLPSLQYLYMENLITPALVLTLRLISPGSHLVAINWTERTSERFNGHGTPLFRTEMSLSNFKVDILFMSGQQHWWHPINSDIRPAMEALPTIMGLYLDSFIADDQMLDALVPTVIDDQDPPTNPRGFPQLKSIYISRSRCYGPKVLQKLSKVLANHPLEELGIGINMMNCSNSSTPSPQPNFQVDSELDLVWESLAHAAPKVTRLPTKASEFSHIAFESHIWQMSGLDCM